MYSLRACLFFIVSYAYFTCSSLSLATEPLETPKPVKFPIMAWDDVRSEDTIRKMSEAGINMIAFTPAELLDACHKHDIKGILVDGQVSGRWDSQYDAQNANTRLKSLIEQYNEHPALLGYHLRDEPLPDQFDELAKSCELIRQLAPGKWAYINLFPIHGVPLPSYANDYIQPFVDKCKPMYLSMDHYAIGEQDETNFSPLYWDSLQGIREVSVKNDIPFHAIILSAAHFHYRVPSFNDLSLQIYGALAYGAQGIGYYKFVGETIQHLDAPELGNWRYAPLDEFGDITPTYYNAKNLNKRLHALAPILLKLSSDQVYHINDIPPASQTPHSGPTETSLIQGFDNSNPMLVGEFTHQEDGSKWVLVVNRSLAHSTFCSPRSSPRVDPKQLKIVSHANGELLDWQGAYYAMAPGQGVLIRLGTLLP